MAAPVENEIVLKIEDIGFGENGETVPAGQA